MSKYITTPLSLQIITDDEHPLALTLALRLGRYDRETEEFAIYMRHQTIGMEPACLDDKGEVIPPEQASEEQQEMANSLGVAYLQGLVEGAKMILRLGDVDPETMDSRADDAGPSVRMQ